MARHWPTARVPNSRASSGTLSIQRHCEQTYLVRAEHFFAQRAASVMASSHGAFQRGIPGIYAAGAGSPTFEQLLLRVKGVVQGAMANADVPFARIVDAAAVPRSSAYTPVFQNMLSLQTESVSDTAADDRGRMAPADRGGMAGLQTEALAVRAGTR